LAWSFVAVADVQPISPVFQGSKTISCTSSSAATALPSTVLQQGQIEVQNAGSATAFLEVGSSTATSAVATGYPVLAGQWMIFTAPQTITHIACITASTTVTVYATIGRGN